MYLVRIRKTSLIWVVVIFLNLLKLVFLQSHVTNNRSQLYFQEDLFPRAKNLHVSISTSIEKQINLEIKQAPKVEFKMKESNHTTVTSDEWHLKTWGSSTTGDNWCMKKCLLIRFFH